MLEMKFIVIPIGFRRKTSFSPHDNRVRLRNRCDRGDSLDELSIPDNVGRAAFGKQTHSDTGDNYDQDGMQERAVNNDSHQ